MVTTNLSGTYTITAGKIALVIKPGVILTGPGTASTAIFADTKNFLWVEGIIAYAARTDFRGLDWITVKFSVLHNLSVSNSAANGISLFSSDSNRLFFITSTRNKGVGVALVSSSNNTLSIVNANSNSSGINLSSSSNNDLSHIFTFSNNGIGGDGRGIIIIQSDNNSLTDVIAADNVSVGVDVARSSNNTLSNITAINNRGGVNLSSSSSSNSLLNITIANTGFVSGLFLSGTVNNTLSNITITNSASYGALIKSNSSNNALMNIAAANHDLSGITLQSSSSNNTFSNTSVANIIGATGTGFSLDTSSNNYFTGLFKTGNNSTSNCSVTGGTLPGLVDTTCGNNGASDAALTTGVTHAASFVGKVTSDLANTSDTNGTATYPASTSGFNWVGFDNIYRGWGVDGSAFPNADNQQQWTAGTGRIWDWSLANGDTGDAGNPVLQNVLSVQLNGNAANTIEHAWVGTAANQTACTALVPGSVWNALDDCRSTYLRNATEVVSDTIGNNNGLCESNETCLFTANIGSYQGHGTLISAGVFTDGDTLTGITLMKYSTNGY